MNAVDAELGDITTYDGDAIVNAANSALAGGGGVDGAIHAAGGPDIARECADIIRRIGSLPTGEAVLTGGGHLPCRFVIHTVGPVWHHHRPTEADDLLRSAYRSSLVLAGNSGCASVAFPNISTGVYGFPKPRAASVAIQAITDEMTSAGVSSVTFVCFDEENLNLYRDLLGGQ